MNNRSLIRIFVTLGLLVLSASQAIAWNLVLADSVTVKGSVVRLSDLVTTPVPDDVSGILVFTGGRPGQKSSLLRRGLLRKLVTAGKASGVKLAGADKVFITFAGSEVDIAHLHKEIRAAIQTLVPAGQAGAPASWFDLEIPGRKLSTSGNWKVELDRTNELLPGRNLVRIKLVDGYLEDAFTATVICHVFGETAKARSAIKRDMPLQDSQFTWNWKDTADDCRDLVVGRESLAGCSLGRSLTAGDDLRLIDLKTTPVVQAGDPVELMVTRGSVSVTVRGFARQNGTLGQTIPVRNELTGRLVNARVAGPGLVEWRK